MGNMSLSCILIEISIELPQYFRFRFFANSIFSLIFHDSNYQPLDDVFAVLYLSTVPANQFSAGNFEKWDDDAIFNGDREPSFFIFIQSKFK